MMSTQVVTQSTANAGPGKLAGIIESTDPFSILGLSGYVEANFLIILVYELALSKVVSHISDHFDSHVS